MVKQCPAACGQCDKNCSDVYNTESCQAWAANNGCETNPQWMFQMCKKSCGACDARKTLQLIVTEMEFCFYNHETNAIHVSYGTNKQKEYIQYLRLIKYV